MSTSLERIHRLIEHDEALRAGGTLPESTTVDNIINYAVREKLTGDPRVRGWMIAVARSTLDWHALKLLDVALPLVALGHANDACAIFRAVFGLEDEGRWARLGPNLTGQHLLTQPGFEKTLGHPGLLANHPTTWGMTAVDLLSRLLVEYQRRDWPNKVRLAQVMAEHGGSPSKPDEPFTIEYDDHPDVWYFANSHERQARYLVARAIENALRDATALDAPETFQGLSNALIETGFATAIALPLVALHDCPNEKEFATAWQVDEAVRVLSLECVGSRTSLQSRRRLLRRKLPASIPLSAREAIVQVIRHAQLPEIIRNNELSDLESWDVLSEKELTTIVSLRNAGNLYEPSDRRQRKRFEVRDGFQVDPSSRCHGWPYKEDHSLVELLSKQRARGDATTQGEDFEADLRQRLQALKVILGRPEAHQGQWFGEVFGWCRQAIADLKSSALAREGTGAERDRPGENAQLLLATHTPWWQSQVEVALDRIKHDVPDVHKERLTAGLAWGSADPIYQSLGYLDEVLAVDAEQPFAAYREHLGEIIDGVWGDWPPFTRATALLVLRPWYWAHIPSLRHRLSATVDSESSPIVMEHCLHVLIQIGAKDIVDRLDVTIRRTGGLPEFAGILRMVGNVLGDAAVRVRDDNPRNDILRALEEFFHIQAAATWPNQENYRSFIDGVIWGAADHLREITNLTKGHAESWVRVAHWAIEHWLDTESVEDDDNKMPITPISLVLEQRWTSDERRQLYDRLADDFLRIMREGTLGDFCWLHFELLKELRGDIEGNKSPGPRLEVAISDALLVRFCEASADHFVRWRGEGKQTNDIGWAAGLTGYETAKLIRSAFDNGRDRSFLRRMLLPIIDCVADAGALELAAELRAHFRRTG